MFFWQSLFQHPNFFLFWEVFMWSIISDVLKDLICDCASLVLALVFCCFHLHKLPLYDLSGYTPWSRGKERQQKGQMKERDGDKRVSTERWRHNSKERKYLKKRERMLDRRKNKNERKKKENKDKRKKRARCGPFISRLLQGISGQHTCYYSLQRK